MDRWQFYRKSFTENISKDSNLLLISASENEINILRELGYNNFSITFHDINNEKKLMEKGFLFNKNLFKSDIRNMKFENHSFDYVVTNATIHHVDLPHNAITEMYRVSKKGVLIIESNDSLIVRLACKLNLAEEFEVSSVNEKQKLGGILDTGIPNYVYRWTEREIIKIIKSYDPLNINYIKFDYDNDLSNIKTKDNFLPDAFIKIVKLFAKIFFFIFKKQQNCLSIFLDKTKSKKRWLNKYI